MLREDPLLETYMAKSDVATRASVLGHLGWTLMNSEEVDDEILRNARSLWDWRANAVRLELTTPQELHGFYWWVRSAKFDPSWWLPRLQQVADDAAFQPMGMIGGPLEDAAHEHAGEALDILTRLLRRQEDRHFTRHDLIRHAPGVIAAALASSQPDVRRDAQELMDSLARAGHVNMRDLVGQVQQSRPPTTEPPAPSQIPD